MRLKRAKKKHRAGKFLPGAVCSSLFLSRMGHGLGRRETPAKAVNYFVKNK